VHNRADTQLVACRGDIHNEHGPIPLDVTLQQKAQSIGLMYLAGGRSLTVAATCFCSTAQYSMRSGTDEVFERPRQHCVNEAVDVATRSV
jgi:hypothetical protein